MTNRQIDGRSITRTLSMGRKIERTCNRCAWLLLVLALAGTVCLPAKAALVNGNFSQINTNPVVVHVPGGIGGAESAAKHWMQWTVVPNSTITTRVEPLGKFDQMLHVTTDAGYSPAWTMGNGFEQEFASMPLTRASFWICVDAGQVTGGLGLSSGPFADFAQFSATGQWKQYVEVVTAAPVKALAFETLAYTGADYYVADAQVAPWIFFPGVLKDISGQVAYSLNLSPPNTEIRRVMNISQGTLTGPFHVLLKNITPGRHLIDPDGHYLGSPFVTVPASSLTPGQNVVVTLHFDPVPNGSIPAYQAVIVAGGI